MWGCLKRVVDPDTGKPLSRALLGPEMSGIFLGALDTTGQTCAITLCALNVGLGFSDEGSGPKWLASPWAPWAPPVTACNHAVPPHRVRERVSRVWAQGVRRFLKRAGHQRADLRYRAVHPHRVVEAKAGLRVPNGSWQAVRLQLSIGPCSPGGKVLNIQENTQMPCGPSTSMVAGGSWHRGTAV